MLKLAIIFIFIHLSPAKLLLKSPQYIYNELDDFDGNKNAVFIDEKIDSQPINSLWVLNIRDESFDFQRLYLATGDVELNVYKNIIVPAIENYELQKRYNGDDKAKDTTLDEKQQNGEPVVDLDTSMSGIKNELFVMINKLFLTDYKAPDSYLHEVFENEKTFKLYFTGAYTSLIMTAGNTKYHYFINPPSPLPDWFYKRHENITTNEDMEYVDIPVEVQDDFLKKFLHLLQMSVGYPS